MNAIGITILIVLVALFGLVVALCYVAIRPDLPSADDVGGSSRGAEEGSVCGGSCGEEPRQTRQDPPLPRPRKKKRYPQGEPQ